MKQQRKFKIGDRIWTFDENRRVYGRIRTARPGPEDRMGAEMSDKRLIFPCGAYFQRNFDDTNWESAHREKNGAYLVTVYPGEQPYDEKRGKQAACLWGCPTPERRMEERDAHGSRINYVSCHARLHDANGSDTLDELIANVDDVTIRRHVIVPRASWYEIVRLLRGQPAEQKPGKMDHSRDVWMSGEDH